MDFQQNLMFKIQHIRPVRVQMCTPIPKYPTLPIQSQN